MAFEPGCAGFDCGRLGRQDNQIDSAQVTPAEFLDIYAEKTGRAAGENEWANQSRGSISR